MSLFLCKYPTKESSYIYMYNVHVHYEKAIWCNGADDNAWKSIDMAVMSFIQRENNVASATLSFDYG